MKKIAIAFFIVCIFLFLGCKTRSSHKYTQNTSQSSPQNEQIPSVPQPQKRLRIRELDWYVGKWKEVIHDDLNMEKSPSTIELEINKNGDEYEVTLIDNGNIVKGTLYVDKYFLPKNVPDEEKSNYDSRDFVVADFTIYKYWIGIRYNDDLHDKISLNLDDIDVFELTRE